MKCFYLLQQRAAYRAPGILLCVVIGMISHSMAYAVDELSNPDPLPGLATPRQPVPSTSQPRSNLPSRAATEFGQQLDDGLFSQDELGPAPRRSLRPEAPQRPEFEIQPRPGTPPSSIIAAPPLPMEAAPPEAADAAQVPARPVIEWNGRSVSIGDLAVDRPLTFRHREPGMDDAEIDSYVDLIQRVSEREFAARSRFIEGKRFANEWEVSFYQFENLRRTAWKAGTNAISLNLSPTAVPGAHAGTDVLTEPLQYSVYRDMIANPEQFVGRQVVLYGMFSVSGQTAVPVRNRLEGEPREIHLYRGTLRQLGAGPDAPLIASVDTPGSLDPQNQRRPKTVLPLRETVPVLVKGWFIKLQGQVPLIYTQAVRVLSTQPFDQLVDDYVETRSGLKVTDQWLYYETLRQMELTDGPAQQQLAMALRVERIEALIEEIQDKGDKEKRTLEQQFQTGRISESKYRERLLRVERQLESRRLVYESIREAPSRFSMFVDLVRNPEEWKGEMVSLSGHVRRVIAYPGDDILFEGRMLYELWLYTDDSQNLPTVIVTPHLPPDFPRSADSVDHVSVTGCFFKLYAYHGIDSSDTGMRRLAPLLLCGRIDWAPTEAEVARLVEDGFLDSDSALARSVAHEAATRRSDVPFLVGGFLVVIALMTVWGRIHRDRRERHRLKHILNGDPHFDSPSTFVDVGPGM
ncbi:MAG: hypothetical protein KDA96_21170 [Planctomycetaceae bacterium]|nr:hypothetical protein [Planctomycetaceae bacterium]